MSKVKSITQPYCYPYARPAVTVDVVAFALVESALRVLLIQRGQEPFFGRWAFPGGFLEANELPEVGASRELREETGLEPKEPLIFLEPFGDPNRDPRGWTISLAYMVLVGPPLSEVVGSDDATKAEWHDMLNLPLLAFDHSKILIKAFTRLYALIDLGDHGVEFLPEVFTLDHIEILYHALGETTEEAIAWRDYLLHLGRIELLPRSKSKYRRVHT